MAGSTVKNPKSEATAEPAKPLRHAQDAWCKLFEYSNRNWQVVLVPGVTQGPLGEPWTEAEILAPTFLGTFWRDRRTTSFRIGDTVQVRTPDKIYFLVIIDL